MHIFLLSTNSSCCSIFKDQVFYLAVALCDSLISIPHLFSFVKGFLKSFFKFFQLSFPNHSTRQSCVRCCCCQQLLYCSTSLFVCQEVFQKFFELFSIFSFKPLGSPDLCSLFASRWQFGYYSTTFPFCQAFFHKNIVQHILFTPTQFVQKAQHPNAMHSGVHPPTYWHRTVTLLPPPVVQVYSDRSNPLVIISLVAVLGSVSKRTTSYRYTLPITSVKTTWSFGCSLESLPKCDL